MRAMTLPACCPLIDSDCPLAETPAGAVYMSAAFDPRLLVPGDFERCGIPVPPSIQRSVAKRQSEYLAGRLCARAASQALDGRNQVPALGEDRAPIWPEDVCGAITHSHGHAAAIVALKSQWQALGMDLEQLLSLERALRLCDEILTPAERERLDPGREALQITLTFSAKESLFKALYPLTGVRFYFEDAELLSWDETGHARLRLLTTLSPAWQAGCEVNAQFAVQQDRLLSLIAIPAQVLSRQ